MKYSFHLPLTELEIRQVIFGGQLCEDGSEVDAGGTPRSKEGHHPGHMGIALEFVFKAVGAEVDDVLGALISGLGQEHSLLVKTKCIY